MPEIRETYATIVLVGKLNPLIFQPEWMRANGLIGQKEAEDAREGGIEVIHPEVTSIALANMKLQVDPYRFVIQSIEEPIVRAKDFAVGCFQLLSHTPTGAVGLNYAQTFRVKNMGAWHRFGDKLAPKEPWGALYSDASTEAHPGGLRTMVMELGPRADGRSGFIRVTVEALETGAPDTKITVNDHYDISQQSKPADASVAVKLIEECWENSMRRAKAIVQSLMDVSDAV